MRPASITIVAALFASLGRSNVSVSAMFVTAPRLAIPKSSTTSSSWPWMKNTVDAFARSPISPVDKHDQRPLVKDLIDQQRAMIDDIREGVKSHPLYDPVKHDDLWLLRFAMSHNKPKKAIEAVKETLAFRKKYRLDEMDIRDTPPQNLMHGPHKKYVDACDDVPLAHTVPDPLRGVVSFVSASKFNQQRLLDSMTQDELLEAFTYVSEWTFQHVDRVTRTTGRYTKAVQIHDFEGYTREKFSMAQSRREGQVNAVLDRMYPEMIDSVLICNAPTWTLATWRVLRSFMPQSVSSKMDFLNPRDNAKERRRLLEHISEDRLPTEYGGKNKAGFQKHWAQ